MMESSRYITTISPSYLIALFVSFACIGIIAGWFTWHFAKKLCRHSTLPKALHFFLIGGLLFFVCFVPAFVCLITGLNLLGYAMGITSLTFTSN